jgi:hypothetical protein
MSDDKSNHHLRYWTPGYPRMKGGVGSHPNRIFDNPIELHQELKKWDKEFSKKLKETGQKFESVAIRAIYTDDLNKKVFKNKKWT